MCFLFFAFSSLTTSTVWETNILSVGHSTFLQIAFREEVVGHGFQLLKRHLFHGMLYLPYEGVALIVVVIGQSVHECRLYVLIVFPS